MQKNSKSYSWEDIEKSQNRIKVILSSATGKCKEVLEKDITEHHIYLQYICESDKKNRVLVSTIFQLSLLQGCFRRIKEAL